MSTVMFLMIWRLPYLPIQHPQGSPLLISRAVTAERRPPSLPNSTFKWLRHILFSHSQRFSHFSSLHIRSPLGLEFRPPCRKSFFPRHSHPWSVFCVSNLYCSRLSPFWLPPPNSSLPDYYENRFCGCGVGPRFVNKACVITWRENLT